MTGGGWNYNWHPARAGGDNSVCQWAAIGIIPAERQGWAQIAPFVTALNPAWLVYTQTSSGGNTGAFGYNQPNYFPWGLWAVTPSGMVQMVMDGIGRGDLGSPLPGFPSWDNSEKLLRDNYETTSTSAATNIKSYYYGLFSFVKSMRLHVPPITMLRDYTGAKSDIDWYNHPTYGVARNLVNDQFKGGGY